MSKLSCVIFLLSLFYFNADGLEISVQEKRTCQPIVEWEMSQTAFFNIAYNWTHGSDLKNWKFACDLHHKSESTSSKNTLLSNIQCCDMSYKTHIHIPTFIQKLLMDKVVGNELKKSICISKNGMHETVQIMSVPIIDTLSVHVYANTLPLKRVRFDMQTNVDLSWYLYPLASLISQHVKKSFREYIDILAAEVCNK